MNSSLKRGSDRLFGSLFQWAQMAVHGDLVLPRSSRRRPRLEPLLSSTEQLSEEETSWSVPPSRADEPGQAWAVLGRRVLVGQRAVAQASREETTRAEGRGPCRVSRNQGSSRVNCHRFLRRRAQKGVGGEPSPKRRNAVQIADAVVQQVAAAAKAATRRGADVEAVVAAGSGGTATTTEFPLVLRTGSAPGVHVRRPRMSRPAEHILV